MFNLAMIISVGPIENCKLQMECTHIVKKQETVDTPSVEVNECMRFLITVRTRFRDEPNSIGFACKRPRQYDL